jgi:uncharacterized protein YbaA (DUF1428 family)
MSYVDGFVIPLRKDKLDDYRVMAEKAGKIWMDHGALSYKECIGDDMQSEYTKGFPQIAGMKENETVIFAFIVYASREQRDEVNAKVMADPRIKESCDENNMPFDPARMAYGGFKSIVEF